MEIAPALEARTSEAFLEVWRLLARRSGLELREQDGLLTYFSLAPEPSFNPTVVTHPIEDPHATLAAREQAFADRGIPFGFEVQDGLDPATEQAALSMGMIHHKTLPALAMASIPDIAPPPIRIEIVDEQGLEDHMQTQSRGFGDSMETLRSFCLPSFLPVCDYLLGRVDGEPVSTSITCVIDGVAGIFGVSTPPEHRRKGYGRMMTEAALRRAKELGADIAYLHSTEMAYRLYSTIGFRRIGAYKIYIRPAEDVVPIR